ncbi:MAG: TetR/AcrR family transcriptional regulator [Opitutaceae bacterium]
MPRKRNTRNGKPTDARILETATRLFAEKGYHGTSVDEIVDRTGVNKRMVYHYFGSKLALYQRVLAAAYEEVGRYEERGLEGARELGEIAERLVRIGFEFHRDHPEFTSLILWENLNKGRGIRSATTRFSKAPVLARLRAAQRAAPVGKYRGIDPRFLYLAMVGLTQIYISNRYTLSQGLGLDLGSPAVLKNATSHVIRFVRAGLAAG